MHIPVVPIGRVIGEFAIIALGVLAAFAVEDWRDDQRERELESEYLVRLGTDVQLDLERLDFTLKIGYEKVDALKAIGAWRPSVNVVPKQMIRRLGESVGLGWSLPALNTSTIEDLESTGNLGLIRDVGTRKAILEYYRELRGVRERLERRMTRYPHHVYEVVPSELLRASQDAAVVPLNEAGDVLSRAYTAVEIDSAVYERHMQRIVEDIHSDHFQKDLRAEGNYARMVVDLIEAHRANAARLLEKLLQQQTTL